MNNAAKLFFTLLGATAIIGCSSDESSSALTPVTEPTQEVVYTTVTQANGMTFELPIESAFSNLSTPESVTAFGSDVYISNIGGAPGGSPGLGFLVKNGEQILSGLEDPKGMAVIAGGKYAILSDHPTIKLIDLETETVVQTLEVTPAGFLNDAVALSENVVLVSDTGTGDVLRVELVGDSISYSTLITASQLGGNGVNGLAFDEMTSTLYLVTSSFGGNAAQGHIYQVQIASDLNLLGQIEQWSPEILGNGNLDGVAVENGNLIVSDWESEANQASVFIFDIASRALSYTISGNFSASADVALSDDNILYIPEFNSANVAKVDVSSLVL